MEFRFSAYGVVHELGTLSKILAPALRIGHTRTTCQADLDGPVDNKYPRVIYIPGEYCVHPKGRMVPVNTPLIRPSFVQDCFFDSKAR